MLDGGGSFQCKAIINPVFSLFLEGHRPFWISLSTSNLYPFEWLNWSGQWRWDEMKTQEADAFSSGEMTIKNVK
ncbi:putative pectinesterase/pectinesterase inhibitor [Trichinella pseudospiralis]